MNGFVSNAAPIVSAVAWPLAALAIAALFRREVRLALDRLARLKYGAMELTFRDDLREAEALARSLPASPPPPSPVDHSGPGATVRFEVAAPDTALETLGTLLVDAAAEGQGVVRPRDRRSPSDAIRRAWDDLAHAVVEAAARFGDRRESDSGRPGPALRFLVDRGYLGGDEGRLIEQLRRLADRTDQTNGHDGLAPGRAEAERFAALAGPVRDRLLGLA